VARAAEDRRVAEAKAALDRLGAVLGNLEDEGAARGGVPRGGCRRRRRPRRVRSGPGIEGSSWLKWASKERPRAFDSIERFGDHAEQREALGEPVGIEVEAQRGFERGHGQLVDAEGAHERVARAAIDAGLAADEDAGLRAAQELVAAEEDEVGAGLDAAAGQRFTGEAELAEVDQGAAADVVDDGDATAASERDERFDPDRFGEADNAKVAGMDAHEGAGVFADGRRVVVEAGAVGGADLAQAGAGGGHDLGQSKAAADLDELSAGHDDLAIAREGVEREHGGGGVVVDDKGGFASGEGTQEGFDAGGAGATPSRFAADGDIAVAAGDGVDGGERLGGEGAAAHAGVDDDAGGVDRSDDPGRGEGAQAGETGIEGESRDGVGVGGAVVSGTADFEAEIGEGVADDAGEQMGREAEGADSGVGAEFVDGGDSAEDRGGVGRVG
jgi:hypothetical protein